MRALVMGPQEEAALARLREFAEKNRIDVDEVLDIFNGQVPPVGDRKGFSCNIPVGYRVVFCIEYQKKGWARHMSVSIHPSKPNQCAHPEAIRWFMEQLDFIGRWGSKDVMVYFENNDTIVNVVEYIK